MVFITSPKSPKNVNPVLSTLRKALKENSFLLESLEIHKISIHPLHDQYRIYEKSIARFKIQVGMYNYGGRDLPIFAYLHGEDKVLSKLFIAYYIFPYYGMGTKINIADHLGPAIIDKPYCLTGSRHDINVILKSYFILQGIAHEGPITFDLRFVRNMIRICKVMASSHAASKKPQEQPDQPRTENPSLKIERSETAHEHEELPNPSTTALKQEPDHRPKSPDPANQNAVRISNSKATPPSTTSTQPKVQPLPIRPSPEHPRSTPSKSKIDATLLEQHFTLPLTTARATEKSLDNKIRIKKRKLDENREDIERLWSLIEVADKKKLKLEGKIKDYEGRRDDAQKTQRELVEGLDPGLRRFVRVAREMGVGEGGEEEEEGE